MKIDLHTHTTFSDGGTTLQKLFDELKKNKVELVSITDHDNTEAYNYLPNVNTHGIKVLQGVEVTVLPNSNPDFTLHILMYDFDRNSKYYKIYEKQIRKLRIERFKMQLAELESLFGFNFDAKKVKEFIKYNEHFDKTRLNNLLVELGYAETARDAYYKYTNQIQDNLTIGIHEDSFFELAKDINATTILAHPMKYLKLYGSMSEIKHEILRLQARGLDGIEVFNYRQTKEEGIELINFANKNNLLTTGGSDYHNKYGEVENKKLGTALGENITDDKITYSLNDLQHEI